MNATPNTVYETCSSDYTTLINHAMRADGQWFIRYQQRHPRFGYRWQAWRETAMTPDRLRDTGRKARLPQ